MREMFKIRDDDEVRDLIASALENIHQPVEVIFQDSKCTACGLKEDRRLLPEHCHMDKQMVHQPPVYTHMKEKLRHPGSLEAYHPESAVAYHPSKLGHHHPGHLNMPPAPDTPAVTRVRASPAAVPSA